jgi:hypothetical protein
MALPISNIPSLGLARLVDGLSLDLSQIVAPIAQISFTVDRDAAYNNSVGFYRALDADGAIETNEGILMPSDAGYMQAALQNSLAIALQSGLTLGTDNGKQANVSFDLETSAYYLPILVANGTLADAANGGKLNRSVLLSLDLEPLYIEIVKHSMPDFE